MSSGIDFGVTAVSLKIFTVKEVYDALAANGFEHLRGKWIDVDAQGRPIGGCVLGQTAVNLGVYAESEQFGDSLYDLYEGKCGKILDPDDDSDYVDIDERVELDVEQFSSFTLETQLNNFSVSRDNKWYEGGDKAAQAIIYWNDKVDNRGNTSTYALPTYQDVTQMAYDILSPHFNRTVEIAVQEYDLSARKNVNV